MANDEYRSEQGTIVPTLFVGLGGTGSRIVNRIAQRAGRLPNWDSQLRPLTMFVALDTNKFDLDKLSFIPQGNRLHIGAVDRPRMIRNFRDNHYEPALQWLPANYEPRAGITPGAGQIRLEARLGYFCNSGDIQSRLRSIVKETLAPGITWRRTVPREYHVYFFSTVAGGTGSGSFLPMAYLVRDVILAEGEWQPRIIANLLLSTMVTDRVGAHLHPDIHANSYAALKELEHLTKLDYKQVREEGRQAEPFVYLYDPATRAVSTVESPPFFLSLIYDRSSLTLHDVEGVVGDTAYLQIFTPNIGNMAGALDNYEKRLGELTRFAGNLREVGQGYAKNFGVVGAAALVLPGDDLLEYCALRFAAEGLRSQVTFGVDTAGGTDDRARALARLAVNYDEPKFKQKSDEAREQDINRAFVESVREMARVDARQELRDGFWYRLVEGVDEGREAGVDEKGEVRHAESVMALVKRRLEEARRVLASKVVIRERAFMFDRDGINQYREYVDRLREDIRAARAIVEEGLRGLRSSAADGDVVTDLRLDPISERYLVLRLLEDSEGAWIPEAQKQHDTAKTRDINDTKVTDRLEEFYQALQDAAARGRWKSRLPFIGGDQEFENVRNEAQEFYRGIGTAARRLFDAEIQLSQFREVHGYLRKRARLYARLATHVNRLVGELETTAAALRMGAGASAPRLALSVEVFETLDEPRERLWPDVYRVLYVDGGRYLSTFDRNTLAASIAEQLKPVVRADGVVVEKSEDETIADLRRALVDLGRQRLRLRVFGGDGQPALDVGSGLELEARIVLGARRPDSTAPAQDEIDRYVDLKLRALAQMSGVLARSSATEWAARGDGVVVDRTRYLVHGAAGLTPRFTERLRNMLAADNRPLNVDVWHDPRIVVVYDVELPIPLYYVRPVIDELERNYLAVAADQRRGYNLHVDLNWEEALPNLNPYKAEIVVGWSLRSLADGLAAGVIDHTAGRAWRWMLTGGDTETLGETLTASLYRLGDLHRQNDFDTLRKRLEDQIGERLGRLTPEERAERQANEARRIGDVLSAMELRKLRAQMTPADALDRPVLRTLVRMLAPERPAGRG